MNTNMNDYQQALNNVKDFCGRRFECSTEKSWLYEEIETLKELVDKATPKKPIKDSVQDVYYLTKYTCPTCGGKFTGTISDYCYHCGQKLDWSEDERNKII